MARVFIVDDEPSIRDLLHDILSGSGHDTREFGSAEEFLEALPNERPDLVVLDFHLPGKQGWEIVGDIRQTIPGVPIVALTAAGGLSLQRSAAEGLGLDGFIRKPFRLAELLDTVERLVSAARA